MAVPVIAIFTYKRAWRPGSAKIAGRYEAFQRQSLWNAALVLFRGRGMRSYLRLSIRPCPAASASRANCSMYAKNAGDWPMKSPISVKNRRAPMAAPWVFVGRMIETIGRLRSRNGHGSGMIKLLFRSSLATLKSGNVTETPVIGSTAVSGGALPALSDQV